MADIAKTRTIQLILFFIVIYSREEIYRKSDSCQACVKNFQ